MKIKVQASVNEDAKIEVDIDDLLDHFNKTLGDLPEPVHTNEHYEPTYSLDKRHAMIDDAENWCGPVYTVDDLLIAFCDFACHQEDIISKVGECLNLSLDSLYELQAMVSGKIRMIERSDIKDADRPDPLNVLKDIKTFIEERFTIKGL